MVPPPAPVAGLGGGVGRGAAGCDPLRANGFDGPATFTFKGSLEVVGSLNLAAIEETLGLPRVSAVAGEVGLAGEEGQPGTFLVEFTADDEGWDLSVCDGAVFDDGFEAVVVSF